MSEYSFNYERLITHPGSHTPEVAYAMRAFIAFTGPLQVTIDQELYDRLDDWMKEYWRMKPATKSKEKE